jgi:hypothetical protein
MRRSGLKTGFLLAAALALPSCEKAPLTAPDGSEIFLQANPTFVVANGGVSVITAVVVEPAGTFVPDGTEVFFFTDLGSIDQSGQTVNGIARVNFIADARSGTANIRAFSGQKPGSSAVTTTVAVGSANPKRVLVTVDPPAIQPGRAGQLTATVYDTNGNPVQNVPVSFSLDSSAVEERLESGGAVLYTNANGQAFDTIRTSAQPPTDSTVTVTATTANGITGTVSVAIYVQ